jgi:hypothetical protein
MWPSESKCLMITPCGHAANISIPYQGGRRKPPQKKKETGKAIFFDNSDFNMESCDVFDQIMCRKVAECSGKKSDEKKCHDNFFKKFKSESNSEVKKIANLYKKLLETDHSYCDSKSGIKLREGVDQFLKNYDTKNIKDNVDVIFDWDRTLTQVEGFLFTDWGWIIDQYNNEYDTLISKRDKKAMTLFKRNHTKFMFGGTVRFKLMQKLVQGIPSEHYYILTNNPAEGLIYEVASILSSHISRNHVISMHNPKKNPKGYVDKLDMIDDITKGYVPKE